MTQIDNSGLDGTFGLLLTFGGSLLQQLSRCIEIVFDNDRDNIGDDDSYDDADYGLRWWKRWLWWWYRWLRWWCQWLRWWYWILRQSTATRKPKGILGGQQLNRRPTRKYLIIITILITMLWSSWSSEIFLYNDHHHHTDHIVMIIMIIWNLFM